jgi:amino acid adenylation domain-containing protein
MNAELRPLGPRAAGYPLTPAQRRIWSLAQIGNTALAGEPILDLRLAGPFDLPAWQEAVEALARRHPSLRMRFRQFAGGRIEQSADEAATIPFAFADLSGGGLEQARLRLDALLADEAPIDLEEDLPARALAAKLGPDEHRLVLRLHPIICDAASLRLLAQDLTEAAPSPAAGHSTAWLQPRSESEATLAFWRDWLAEDHADGTLPTVFVPAAEQSGARADVAVSIDAMASRAIRRAAEALGEPLQVVLLTAFNVLLARYAGQFHLKFGAVVDNRVGDQRGTVGRLEDVLPLKTRLSSRLSFRAAVTEVAAALRLAKGHYMAFERLAQEFWENNEENGSGFVQAIHDHRPAMPLAARRADGLAIELIDRPDARKDANLVLTTVERSDGTLTGAINYAVDLFDGRLVTRAAGHLAKIVAAVGSDPDILLRDIALVSSEELEWLATPYDDDEADDERPIHALIAEHGRDRPEAPAIYFGDRQWSHGELERWSNRLAHRLIAAGVGPEACVAVAVRRSPEAIGAILATLKAGAAFIPIEPDHPASRNDHIFRDAGVAVVVTMSGLRDKIPAGVDATVIELDRIDLASGPDHDPGIAVGDRQLAYVIYTSGSTGLPKGVAVEHGPLTRHCQTTARVYEMSAQSCELPFLPFSSDGGHERWIVPLMVGGSIVLPDKPLWTPEETFAAMRRHGVNNASFPTTYVQQLAEWADMTGDPPPMRLYSFGGEGMAQATFDLFSRALKSEWLINGYGPTETIMTPMVWKVRAGTRFEGMYAPIGRAVGRRRIYVLDEDLNPAPIGVTGELYLGGDGVARGYVGRSAATAERFVPDPFDPAGGRLYKSGDLARWREDGTVEFVGRVDHQVKLRGFRIELGEIEAILRTLPGVSECVVLMRQDGGQAALVGYAVPAPGTTLDGAELRRALGRQLPDYMVPSAVMVLDRFPLNANSKLDRSALPAPALAPTEIVPPKTPMEAGLCGIWQDVLGLPAVGVTQNFFEIGGNSMAALRILGRIKQWKTDASIAIADLFNHQTIRSLADMLETGKREGGGQIIHLRSTGTRPMLYCFPGLLVSTREYVKLIDHLGPDQPATGFICYSLAEENKLDASVTEITARYAELIRQRSRGEPCFFLGWSWGGLLAYEAARMLKDDIDLRLVGMIDVCDMDTDFAIGAVPVFQPGEREELEQRVRAWLAHTPMRAQWGALLASMDAQAYDQFLRYVGNSEDDLPSDGPDIGSREHTFWVLIDNALIFRQHRMLPHDCPIQSWAAADSLNRGLNLIDWRQFSRLAGPAEIIEGTTHLHIIGAPAFHSRFARKLDEACSSLSRAAE